MIATETRVLRSLIEGRLDDLEEEITQWRGKHSQGGRPGITEAIEYVSHYPAIARRELHKVDQDKDLSSWPSSMGKFSSRVARVSARLRTWFGNGDFGDGVPVALHNAVSKRCLELGLGPHASIIVVGRPNTFECRVQTLKEAVYGSGEAPSETPTSYAILEVPPHEGRSPRWWPVVLGHELSHLRVHKGLVNLDSLEEELRNLYGTHFAQQGASSAEPANVLAQTAILAIAGDWIVEVLCDLAGVHSFGPAALAAFGSHLWALDQLTEVSDGHPPGWLRQRLMRSYLGEGGGEFYSPITDPWNIPSDEDEVSLSEEYAIAVKLVELMEESLFAEIRNNWDLTPYDAHSEARQDAIDLARDQLQLGIPPFTAYRNAFPHGFREVISDNEPDTASPRRAPETSQLDKKPIEIEQADLFNACWLEEQAERARSNDAPLVPVDRLVLKAIENQGLVASLDTDKFVPPQPPKASTSTAPKESNESPSGAVLGKKAILRSLASENWWERLIITPPFTDSIGPASYDLRLGSRFIIFRRTATSSFSSRNSLAARSVQRSVECNWGEPFVLHPGELVLASVLEYLVMPAGLSAQVVTRSSYGRLGLITATAVQVHPNYRGCLTLELVNLGTVPLELYPGEGIAQLVFFTADVEYSETGPLAEDLFKGSYVCPTGPQFPQITPDVWVFEQLGRIQTSMTTPSGNPK